MSNKPFFLSSIFSNETATKPVSKILSGIESLITELKGAISSHTTLIADSNAEIDALKKSIEASQQEIDSATAAHFNLSALIGANK